MCLHVYLLIDESIQKHTKAYKEQLGRTLWQSEAIMQIFVWFTSQLAQGLQYKNYAAATKISKWQLFFISIVNAWYFPIIFACCMQSWLLTRQHLLRKSKHGRKSWNAWIEMYERCMSSYQTSKKTLQIIQTWCSYNPMSYIYKKCPKSNHVMEPSYRDFAKTSIWLLLVVLSIILCRLPLIFQLFHWWNIK